MSGKVNQTLAAFPSFLNAIWQSIEPYLVPGDELKAQYAFQDLWGSEYGDD